MAILIAMVSIAGGQTAVAMSIDSNDLHRAPALRTVADETAAAPLRPFAARPRVESLDAPSPTPSAGADLAAIPLAASPPVAALPNSLSVTASGIPEAVLAAYLHAVRLADQASPGCRLRWPALAGIGFVESDNALGGGSANPKWNGIAFPPILGPVLDGGHGLAALPDTDAGTLDGDPTWDRAVGPMQFLPSTWREYGADGDHDGVANPEDINDATLAAADYLCATGPDLNRPKPLVSAIYAYNHSYAYVRAVLTVAAHYADVNPATLGIGDLPGGRRNSHDRHPSHRPGRRPTRQPTTPAGSQPPAPTPTATPTMTPPAIPTPTPSVSVTPSATPSSSDGGSTAPGHRPGPPRR